MSAVKTIYVHAYHLFTDNAADLSRSAGLRARSKEDMVPYLSHQGLNRFRELSAVHLIQNNSTSSLVNYITNDHITTFLIGINPNYANHLAFIDQVTTTFRDHVLFQSAIAPSDVLPYAISIVSHLDLSMV